MGFIRHELDKAMIRKKKIGKINKTEEEFYHPVFVPSIIERYVTTTSCCVKSKLMDHVIFNAFIFFGL